MYLTIGLGNPGNEYKKTRHNVGWIVIDDIFSDADWKNNTYAHAMVAHVEIANTPIQLVKPQTFMNDSGKSLHYFIDKEDYKSEDIIVIYDDLDLPLGKIKISFDRGNGGHNGIKSLEEALGSRDFIRIRIGISRTLDDGIVIKPNVLGNFDMKELETLQEVSKKVEQAIKSIITDGKEKAMTNFN
jgi:PTH1 family peptidyl-tRNA hydrolase